MGVLKKSKKRSYGLDFSLRSGGFTIIETIVTILVFTLILGAVMGGILTLYRTQDYSFKQSVAVQEARRAAETMIREIREARQGDDGSYPIALAADKEFIFYSDIDKDGAVERVRYFLGDADSGSQVQECVTFIDGGSCSVSFSGFLSGSLQSAEITVSVEGDFGIGSEYAEVFADGISLGNVCQGGGCSDCAASWQGITVFDVTSEAADGTVQLLADARPNVNDICDWIDPNHAMKAKFELNWTESLASGSNELKKGVINPTSFPISYPSDQEQVTVLTLYVRNVPPIFRYYDKDGNEISQTPARLKDTRIMAVYLTVNIDPNRPPDDYELESRVHLRNLEFLQ